MPTLNEPRRSDFLRASGMFGTPIFDQTAYAQALQQYRNAQFEDTYGFPKQFAQQHQAAADAADAEYEQLINELQKAIDQVGADPLSMQIRDHFMRASSGQDRPFDASTIASLSSDASAPIFRGASEGLSRLRDSFAARGLGRSGGLGSMEQQLLQNAILQGTNAASGVRSNAALQNYDARQSATQGAASYFGNISSQRNALIGQLANLRAQRQFTPFNFQGNQQYQPAGQDFQYTVPPPIERRRVGSSAPTYNSGQGGFGYSSLPSFGG